MDVRKSEIETWGETETGTERHREEMSQVLVLSGGGTVKDAIVNLAPECLPISQPSKSQVIEDLRVL